jgi:hypothetical protein
MRVAARALIVVVLLGMVAPAIAQTTISGTVQGVVKGPRGEALAGATVVASSDALVSRRATCITDTRGMYRFPSLPPGAYAIEAQLVGYRTARQGDVRIRSGQSLAIDLKLEVGDIKEEVTVSGRAPIVSVIDNKVGTNFDQQYLADQPLPRNFYTVIETAPGVNVDYTGSSGSAMLAFGGTSESQNAFTLDGVNIADAAAGQHWVLPSIQWMEEIQIGGLGANAEYGGYTGGVINGVTKSGGNTFKGEVEVYYQPASWTANNDPTAPKSEFKFSDIAASFGGPLIKDKLWYFISGEMWNQVTTPYGAVDTSDRKIPRFLGKLTWQLNPTNRLMFMAEYDTVDHERRGISDLVLPEATSHQKAPGETFALHWESLLSRDYFVNVKLTGYNGRDDYLPYHGSDTPGHIDDANTGIAWVNQDIRQLNHRRIVTLDSSLTMYKDSLFGGGDSHTFKFGALYEEGSSSDVWTRNGGFTYYDDSSQCESEEAYFANPDCGRYYIERGYGEYNEMPKYSGYALYAQDSMRLDRVTVNPGLRYGAYQGGWQAGRGTPTVYDVTFVDPRLGVVWDIRGDGRSALKAHWGRYHDKMYTYLFDREASGNATIPDQDCYFNSETGEFDDCGTPTAISARMGKVDHPYVDETILTFEQQLGKQMLIGVDLIDRRFRNIMAMVNANDDYTLNTDLETPLPIENPITGEPMQVWILNSAPDFVLTTDNGARRDFQSAVLRFEKRMANRWSLRSSLVWTDLDGNILKNNGYANEYRDRNGLINADGRMDYAFSEWEFKTSGVVDLPLGFQASGQYTFLSGWYWTPYVRIGDLDDYGYNGSTGRDINLVPRGSEQFPDRHLLNLRFAWTKKLGDTTLTASLEGFAVLNRSTVLDVYNRWGSCYLEDGSCSQRGNYGSTYQIESPRQIRAGLRFAF